MNDRKYYDVAIVVDGGVVSKGLYCAVSRDEARGMALRKLELVVTEYEDNKKGV